MNHVENAKRRLWQGPRTSAAMSSRAAKWNVRSAWNDSFRYAFDGDWVFPFGTGRLDRVEVCSRGRVIPRYGSTDVIASVGVPLQIVNPVTSFGCGPTGRNSYIFAWTNAVAGRVLHEDIASAETLDASIEQPGFVVGHPAAVGSGHVGIVDFDGSAIAAGEAIVNRRYKQWLDGTSGFSKVSN